MTPATDRPALHFTPRAGWLNDPLALTWHEGCYHLFFQHVPDGAAWAANCHWGRATTPDLVQWEEQQVALAPAEDELGAWSGCLVEGRILYTSVVAGDIERGRVRVALPDPGAGDWSRWAPGDVVLPAPDDPSVMTFRDPFVVRDGNRWRMLMGSGLADGTGCALGYVSDDLDSWEPDGVVASRHTSDSDPVWTGSIWECPQVVRVDGTDVLVLSTADPDGPGDVVTAVGVYAGGRFAVRSWQQLTTGAPYAASVFTDREGRPGLLAWLRGVAGDGWAGAVSVPMVLTLDDGRVGLEVHQAVAARRRTWDPAAHAWDLEWEPEDEGEELSLMAPSGRRVARLRAASGHLSVDVEGRRLQLDHDDGLVRVLRDGPVLEVLTPRGLAAAPVPTGRLRPEGRGWRGWALA